MPPSPSPSGFHAFSLDPAQADAPYLVIRPLILREEDGSMRQYRPALAFYRRGSLLVRERIAIDSLQRGVLERTLQWQRLVLKIAVDLGLGREDIEAMISKPEALTNGALAPYLDKIEAVLKSIDESTDLQFQMVERFFLSRAFIQNPDGTTVPLMASEYRWWDRSCSEQLTEVESAALADFFKREADQWKEGDSEEDPDPKR